MRTTVYFPCVFEGERASLIIKTCSCYNKVSGNNNSDSCIEKFSDTISFLSSAFFFSKKKEQIWYRHFQSAVHIQLKFHLSISVEE